MRPSVQKHLSWEIAKSRRHLELRANTQESNTKIVSLFLLKAIAIIAYVIFHYLTISFTAVHGIEKHDVELLEYGTSTKAVSVN